MVPQIQMSEFRSVPDVPFSQALAFAIANERVKYSLGACEQLLGLVGGWVFQAF